MVRIPSKISVSTTLLIVGLLTSCINKGTGTPDKDLDTASPIIACDSTLKSDECAYAQDSDSTVGEHEPLVTAISCDAEIEQTTPTKRAIVVGLGKYQDAAWSEIHGDRDVPIVKQMLKNCGYADISTLTNADATKSRILLMISDLCRRCNQGDIVYIHFSGHGQQVTDVDGDEDDGFDEAWIPYDAKYEYSEDYKGENHLIDDEISVWMQKIRDSIGESGQLLVVADACHSGESTRNRLGDDVYVRGADDDFIIPLTEAPEKRAKTPLNWLTLSACLDYQVNCEVQTKSGDYYGMLTYALCSMYSDLNVLTNDEFMEKVTDFVDRHRGFLPQEPTLSPRDTDNRLSPFFK